MYNNQSLRLRLTLCSFSRALVRVVPWRPVTCLAIVSWSNNSAGYGIPLVFQSLNPIRDWLHKVHTAIIPVNMSFQAGHYNSSLLSKTDNYCYFLIIVCIIFQHIQSYPVRVKLPCSMIEVYDVFNIRVLPFSTKM